MFTLKYIQKEQIMEEVIQYVKAAAAISAALAIGIGTIGPSLAQGMVGSKACENIGKYPESAGQIKTVMITALGFIEASAIYALLVAGAIIFFFK